MSESRPRTPATRAERFSWCLFDFANSAFNTIIVTFVYVTFFTEVLVGDQARGDHLWSNSLAVAGIAIAVISPVLGTLADRTAHKKLYLVVLAGITILCTAGLFFPNAAPGREHGTAAAVWTALILFTAANVSFELMFVFYNAFLPGLGSTHTIGRLSGYGWALGYVGGLLSLVVCLGCVGVGDLAPWLPVESHLNVRATSLVVAGWFALFALPMFTVVRDHCPPVAAAGPAGRTTVFAALGHVLRSVRSLPTYPDLLRLLIARLFYNDATIALISLSGLFMMGTLEMERSSIMLVAIWLNVAAGLGALGFGFVDDFLGAKMAILGSLVLLLSGSLVAIFAPSVSVFVVAATLVGLGMGPNQAASRTMLARFVPPSRSAEFYGLFALSGKATVWLGPLLFSVVRGATEGHEHSQRIAFAPIVGLFVIGLVLLLAVDEKRGAATAAQLDR